MTPMADIMTDFVLQDEENNSNIIIKLYIWGNGRDGG